MTAWRLTADASPATPPPGGHTIGTPASPAIRRSGDCYTGILPVTDSWFRARAGGRDETLVMITQQNTMPANRVEGRGLQKRPHQTTSCRGGGSSLATVDIASLRNRPVLPGSELLLEEPSLREPVGHRQPAIASPAPRRYGGMNHPARPPASYFTGQTEAFSLIASSKFHAPRTELAEH